MKHLATKALAILIVLVAAFAFFVVPRAAMRHEQGKHEDSGGGKTIYYCPMHPTYTSDKPGDCPICYMKMVPKEKEKRGERKILYYRHPMGQPDKSPVPKKDAMGMDYIPVYSEEVEGAPSGLPTHATVRIPTERQQLIGVKLGLVEKRALIKRIRSTGRVAFDAELFTAQQEFLSALDSLKKTVSGPYHEPPERARQLLTSIKLRLQLLGMSEEEIAELEKSGVQDANLILPAAERARSHVAGGPLVWIYAPVYEYELPYVKAGSVVRVRIPTDAGKEISGKVRALDPVLDPMTRSVRMRVQVEDLQGLLKPGMYVDVFAETDLGAVLSLPKGAVLPTGERSIAFVAKGEGYFQPREVELGAEVSDFYEVKSGVSEGERVVVSGNFLIDSESRLQAALTGMGGEGHQHGQ